MNQVDAIGLDMAKSVFQLHGVDVEVRSFSASGSHERGCEHPSRGYRRVSLAWKGAALRTIGGGS